MATLDAERLVLANEILARHATTWADRKIALEEALALDEDDVAIQALERRAKILYGSNGE